MEGAQKLYHKNCVTTGNKTENHFTAGMNNKRRGFVLAFSLSIVKKREIEKKNKNKQEK